MHDLLGSGFLAATVQWGGWKRTGNFTAIDLIAATTNALNGALFARRPDHFRTYLIAGGPRLDVRVLVGDGGATVASDVQALVAQGDLAELDAAPGVL